MHDLVTKRITRDGVTVFINNTNGTLSANSTKTQYRIAKSMFDIVADEIPYFRSSELSTIARISHIVANRALKSSIDRVHTFRRLATNMV